MNLSDRQRRIMAFIREYLEAHNYPPTIREIGQAVGISSTSVVKYNLERLQEKVPPWCLVSRVSSRSPSWV
jgi:repressor LexA